MTVAREAPSPADPGRALWERLVAGDDPTAQSDLAAAYLEPLATGLRRRYPGVDASFPDTAAEEAILTLIRKPAAYQPERQTLDVYLRMSAEGDLKNLLRSEDRHRKRRADLEAVELSASQGKYLWDEDADPANVVERAEDEASRTITSSVARNEVLRGLSPTEARVFDLMQAGERQTGVYARVLGIEDWPIERQRQEVKRVKDRIKKRIARLEHGGG